MYEDFTTDLIAAHPWLRYVIAFLVGSALAFYAIAIVGLFS